MDYVEAELKHLIEEIEKLDLCGVGEWNNGYRTALDDVIEVLKRFV